MEKSQKICRLCLKLESRSFPNFFHVDEDFKTKLKIAIPELDLNLSATLNVCESCKNSVSNWCIFKKECLKVEEKIKHYKRMHYIEKVDLINIVKYSEGKSTDDHCMDEANFVSEYERNNDHQPRRLSWQISAQNEARTENYMNERKRYYPDGISNAEPPKKQRVVSPLPSGRKIERSETSQSKQHSRPETVLKLNDENLDELVGFIPNFSFRRKYNRNRDSIKEWCQTVEKIKEKRNWSDSTAVAVATKKLKFINARNIYMKPNISWNEWRGKILEAFPETDDFTIYMKTVLKRVKTKEETYVNYYHDKMDLLEGMSEERVVSCLIQGILDMKTSVLARIRNFKTSQELLEYFKTCDERDFELKQVYAGKEKPDDNMVKEINERWQMLHKCGSCGSVTHQEKYCPHTHKTKESSNIDRSDKTNEWRQSNTEICSTCHQSGHDARNCPQLNRREKCSICCQFGHNSRSCVQIVGRNSRR